MGLIHREIDQKRHKIIRWKCMPGMGAGITDLFRCKKMELSGKGRGSCGTKYFIDIIKYKAAKKKMVGLS